MKWFLRDKNGNYFATIVTFITGKKFKKIYVRDKETGKTEVFDIDTIKEMGMSFVHEIN
jgi:hypothetical protein